jgi:hypothetical protein
VRARMFLISMAVLLLFGAAVVVATFPKQI